MVSLELIFNILPFIYRNTNMLKKKDYKNMYDQYMGFLLKIPFFCKECDMLYQPEEVTKVIEDQLFLVDTKAIGDSISFKELMELPRLLKRNYFDFSS
jgi:hypothetical protein